MAHNAVVCTSGRQLAIAVLDHRYHLCEENAGIDTNILV